MLLWQVVLFWCLQQTPRCILIIYQSCKVIIDYLYCWLTLSILRVVPKSAEHLLEQTFLQGVVGGIWAQGNCFPLVFWRVSVCLCVCVCVCVCVQKNTHAFCHPQKLFQPEVFLLKQYKSISIGACSRIYVSFYVHSLNMGWFLVRPRTAKWSLRK